MAAEPTTRLVHACELELRWSDLDAYDHVNNAVYLSLMEEARIQWFNTFEGGWRSATAEPVIARTEVNYRRPLHHPARVRVELHLEKLGRSSIIVAHRIVAVGVEPEVLHSDGLTVIVYVDPAGSGSVPVPDNVRRACG
jgi:acyl-CoA thioester hydrolase